MTEKLERRFSLPQDVARALYATINNEESFNAKVLSKHVKRLSDLYNSGQKVPDIWKDKGLQLAYLSYFTPLNFLRASAVIQEAKSLKFFDGIEHFVDFGSGTGIFDLALFTEKRNSLKSYLFVDQNTAPQKFHQALQLEISNNNWGDWTHTFSPKPGDFNSKALASFSYSLNELSELPTWAYDFEAIAILEPSTQKEGRNLLNLRAKLVNRGYHIWAPCTHQKDCPLLKESKKDWCHDRIFVDLPDWFYKVEALLPMKNNTVTYSYLLARKTPSPEANPQVGRIIGDTQKEKGKTKQMVCFDSKRMFLSWLKKDGKAPHIPRGSTIEWPENSEIKGNEIRVLPKT